MKLPRSKKFTVSAIAEASGASITKARRFVYKALDERKLVFVEYRKGARGRPAALYSRV